MMIETAVPRAADLLHGKVIPIRGKVSRALYSILVFAFFGLIAYQGISTLIVAMAIGEELATSRTVLVTAQIGTGVEGLEADVLEDLYGDLAEAVNQEGLAGLEPAGLTPFNAAGEQVGKAGETERLNDL